MVLSAALCGVARADETAPPLTPAQHEAVRAARAEALDSSPRLIFNSDGMEPLLASAPTREALLEARLNGIVGTQVDAIFYSPMSVGLSGFTHHTRVGEVLTTREANYAKNLTAEIHAAGIDPLQVNIDFAQSHGMPLFFSLRMNDTHDAAHKPDAPYPAFTKWKQDNPQLLFGAVQEKPKFGAWSALDYGQPEVRQRVYDLFEEACRNYDIQGLELDFYRHTQLFRRVAQTGTGATVDELELMTDLMRRIRAMTEREAVRRGGEPYLIAMRVPDSVEVCRWLGIDLERWLADGLVDIVIASGYQQYRPWRDSVELAHRHGAKVYAGFENSRVFPSKNMPEEQRKGSRYEPLRHVQQTFRARAADAWQAGVDGIYLYNEYRPAERPHLHEVGSPETLVGLDKLYFAAYLGSGSARAWIADHMTYFTRPTLEPGAPVDLVPGAPFSLDIAIGDDLSAVASDNVPTVTLCLQFAKAIVPAAARLTLNGETLSGGEARGEKLVFDVPTNLLRPGANAFTVTLDPAAQEPVKFEDFQLAVDYPKDETPWPELVQK